jgi:hypothetical protein
MLDEQYGIDERFPRPSRQSCWFISFYPLAVLAAYLLEPRIPNAIIMIGMLFGIGWLLLLINGIIVSLQRAGYEAAIRDFTSLRIAELAAQGKLPPKLQTAIDEQMAKGESGS